MLLFVLGFLFVAFIVVMLKHSIQDNFTHDDLCFNFFMHLFFFFRQVAIVMTKIIPIFCDSLFFSRMVCFTLFYHLFRSLLGCSCITPKFLTHDLCFTYGKGILLTALLM